MRKNVQFLCLTIFAVLCVSLVSCSEDEDIAYTLDGTWEGHTEGRYENYTTTIRFFQDGFSSAGTGYEWDDQHFFQSSDYCGFDWYVSNGRIYLNYDDNTDVIISDYSLDNSNFCGYLTDRRTGRDLAYFRWHKVSNTHDSGWRR